MKYKKGTILQEYFLNPHFKPTEEEKLELEKLFNNLDTRQKWQYQK